ncbi:sigma-70 family RNA polymerase sigma factor [Thauera sp. Sel9]|uniref:sigma-70 family RNA polymerase sigma factor n=1 Tax=Thauera sp. Sel9 TaxID=2974299 RepID=UPI0021E17156|nr:sigma-70 family RNA polymerase sigma factor [Thauera sp. Sel9]MCV2216358.1 sigma-70 family RNA polymerase sigma factor [Thauera sp. Sel9]
MPNPDAPRHRIIHELYAGHHGWLQARLGGKVGSADCAADLAQDVFVRLMAQSLHSLQAIREPRAFLNRIANCVVIDHWRRIDIERAWAKALAGAPPDVVPSAEHCAIVLETLYDICAMIDALPDKPRTTFILARIEGLSYAEIARRLKVSERMVTKYMSQAMLHCIALEEPAGARGA